MKALTRVVLVALAVVALGAQGALAWGATWVVDHRQHVSDRALSAQFVPTAELGRYVAEAGLSRDGVMYLHASLPEVVPAFEFDRYCSRSEPGIGVLGCYRLLEKRIYLYDVTDDRLRAIEPVVAAHEMLHAAWDRFTVQERESLAILLEQAFAGLPDDHPLRDRLVQYEKIDPASRIPELYAIIGTEAADLPADLEEHYSRFFTDRAKVVALAVEVYRVFDELDQQLQALVADLEERLAVITERRDAYDRDSAVFRSDLEVYNDRVTRYNAGENVSGAAGFEEERLDLIARRDVLRVEREAIQRLIDEYNALLDDLEVLNNELAELNRGINIRLQAEDNVAGDNPDSES